MSLLPDPMRTTIARLITQGPQVGPLDPQAKAIECQVQFKSGARAQGALSLTTEGLFRFLCPGRGPGRDGNPVEVLAEHFFDSSSIEAVIILHAIEPVKQSSLIMPGRA